MLDRISSVWVFEIVCVCVCVCVSVCVWVFVCVGAMCLCTCMCIYESMYTCIIYMFVHAILCTYVNGVDVI